MLTNLKNVPLFGRYEVPPEIDRDFRNQYNPWTPSIAVQVSFGYAAAALLAMDHFNARNDTVVPELADLDEDCTVYFPDPKYADSYTDGGMSVKAFFDAMEEKPEHYCAVLGPLNVEANLKLRSALRALNIPMMVHSVENDVLSDKYDVSPETVTMSLSSQGRAQAMLEYLRAREYITGWAPANKGQDALIGENIEKIGKELFGLNVAVLAIDEPPPDVDEGEFVRRNLQQLKDNGITTIFLSSVREPFKLPQFAIYLEQMDMLTNDYFYILPPSLMIPSVGNLTVSVTAIEDLYGPQFLNSPLDKLLSGSVVFDRMDGFDYTFYASNKTKFDPFFSSWKQQGSDQVQRLNDLTPLVSVYLRDSCYLLSVCIRYVLYLTTGLWSRSTG